MAVDVVLLPCDNERYEATNREMDLELMNAERIDVINLNWQGQSRFV